MNKIILLAFLSLISLNSCNILDPSRGISSISMSLADVSCTEVWLRINTSNISLPVNIALMSENQIIKMITLISKDSLVYLDSLKIGYNYNFQAYVGILNSEKLSVRTLDLTSNNYVWQKFSFGDHSGSILYDIAIINDNNIWVTGEIYLNDSTGIADPTPYNGIHWNGTDWKVIRIPTRTFGGTLSSAPIHTIIAFGEKDIWTFSITGSYSHWNGISWNSQFVNELKGGGLRLWGTNSNNLFLGGTNGSLAFYNGSNWNQIETGTDLDINDIYGSTFNNLSEIYAVAAKFYANFQNKIINLKNNPIKEESNLGISLSTNSIWFKPNIKYYIVGDGLYIKNDINSNSAWQSYVRVVTNYYLYSIDGQALNDIAVCGSYGEILHFNGANWHSFRLDAQLDAGEFKRIKIINNMMIAVGYDSPAAVILIGKR